jgi:hypothetical protein
MYAKAAMLVCVGLLASTILVLESPHLRTVAMLALAIWGFSRAYYFAFYVIEHYADPSYRFAGLLDFARYALKRRASPIEKRSAAGANRSGD